MYYDEASDMYFESRGDFERIALKSKIRRGELSPIEGFSRYTVTPEGVVLNISRAKPVKVRTDRSGRLVVSLIRDGGRQTTLSLGRIVAMQFVPRPEDQEFGSHGLFFDVAYRDGDMQNVHADNLVWAARWKRLAKPENYGVGFD